MHEQFLFAIGMLVVKRTYQNRTELGAEDNSPTRSSQHFLVHCPDPY